MTYTPHTPEEVRQMLAAIGVQSIDDLYADVPASLRVKDLDLPGGINPADAERAVAGLAAKKKRLRIQSAPAETPVQTASPEVIRHHLERIQTMLGRKGATVE